MKSDLEAVLITVPDLMTRWSKSRKSIYRLIANYRTILCPVKIGRDYRFEPDKVRLFESQMRVVEED